MHLIWNDPNTKLQMPYEMLIFLFVTLSRLVLCVIVAKFIWVFWNTYVAIEKTTSLSNKMALKPQDLFQNEIVISETEANCQAKRSNTVFVSLESFLSEVWQLLEGVAGWQLQSPVPATSPAVTMVGLSVQTLVFSQSKTSCSLQQPAVLQFTLSPFPENADNCSADCICNSHAIAAHFDLEKSRFRIWETVGNGGYSDREQSNLSVISDYQLLIVEEIF